MHASVVGCVRAGCLTHLLLEECAQVLEVSMVAEHLTTECEKQGQFGICKRCGESVKKAELKAHTAAKQCAPAKPETAANR